MFLQQMFCYQVLKCSSSALLLLILLMGKRNICLCHGDLLIHRIHGKQGFLASMSLSEILAGFSSASPVSIGIENSLTLGLTKIVNVFTSWLSPKFIVPFWRFFKALLYKFWAHFGINQAQDIWNTLYSLEGSCLTNTRGGTHPEMQGE